MSEKFVDPDNYFPVINEDGIQDLYKLIEIVYNCHFSYASEHKEDLYSVGMVKCMDTIKSGKFDATRSSLKNYLYTGIRNEMKNYLHKLSRDVPVDEEIMAGANESPDYRADDVLLLHKIDLPRCRSLDKVYSTLQFMGFNIGVEAVEYPEVYRWVNLAMYQMLRGK